MQRKTFSKRDTVFVKKLLLEFIQLKHKVEGEELQKMTEDEEEWDIFDASAHGQPKKEEGDIGEG